jgi:hypothetical protein
MSLTDALAALETVVRDRMRAAAADKAAYEHDGHRLNAQLMQGELNMGAVVLASLERLAQAGALTPDESEVDDGAGEG